MNEEKKKRILFLDDRSKRLHSALKKFGDQVTLVCTVKETRNKLVREFWDVVSLDHDLNFEEFVDSDRKDCGMEIVRFLVENKAFLDHLRTQSTQFVIHSSNRIGAMKMAGKLMEAGYNSFWSPWEYDDEP